MSLENRTIAVVEDDPVMGESLVHRLTLEGAAVRWWRSVREAAEGLRNARPDVVVCDIRLPDGSGETVFRDAARRPDPLPFLFMTGFGEVDQAVRLLRAGAGDYLTKPFEMHDFLSRLDHLVRPVPIGTPNILGVTDAMQGIERMLARIAQIGSNVMIVGETGSGKEVCARHLHGLRTPSGPFIAVNCAAIPSELMESELFGHERGAFTGAQTRHLGYLERANGGTLFLDEIGELAPKLQSKLLRVLEERTFTRVGGEQTIPFSARVVAATNADLDSLIARNAFRSDLLYRLDVVRVSLPPLRNREADVEWLAERFFVSFNEQFDRGLHGFSALALEALRDHAWPGNVRELRNRVERAVALAFGPWLMPGDLFPERSDEQSGLTSMPLLPLDAARDEAERRQIRKALAQTNGAILAAAKTLGVSRTTLWEKMRRYGMAADGT
jgi:DNA-binding NtrC family response regulator